jgi:hypothetical protein
MIPFHYGIYGLRGNNWGAHHKFLPFLLFKKRKNTYNLFSLIMFEQIAILWREHQEFPHFCY